MSSCRESWISLWRLRGPTLDTSPHSDSLPTAASAPQIPIESEREIKHYRSAMQRDSLYHLQCGMQIGGGKKRRRKKSCLHLRKTWMVRLPRHQTAHLFLRRQSECHCTAAEKKQQHKTYPTSTVLCHRPSEGVS